MDLRRGEMNMILVDENVAGKDARDLRQGRSER